MCICFAGLVIKIAIQSKDLVRVYVYPSGLVLVRAYRCLSEVSRVEDFFALERVSSVMWNDLLLNDRSRPCQLPGWLIV